MRKMKWQWIWVILLVVVSCTKTNKTESNAPPETKSSESTQAAQSNPTPPFKFSISYKEMKENPRNAQSIVEKELASNSEEKRIMEMEARHKLGLGFQTMGDYESAAKNFLRCESLSKDKPEEAMMVADCLLGLARVARFSSSKGELTRLYDLRNSPRITPDLKAQFYAELINNRSFNREFAKAKKLVNEIEPSFNKLKPFDQYMIRYSQLLMLIDAKESDAAEPVLTQARQLATKLGPQSVAWVDHAEANYQIVKKDFAKAKSSYEKAIPVIGSRDSQINAFWPQYLGLKVSIYTKDETLRNNSHTECKKTISSSEMGKMFLPLIDAWVKLSKGEDITADLKALNKSFGPNTNIVEELNVAKAWYKSK